VNIGLFTARPCDKLQTGVCGGKSWRQLRYSPGHTHHNDDMSGPVRAIAQMCVCVYQYGLTELKFYIPHNTKQVMLETFFLANPLA